GDASQAQPDHRKTGARGDDDPLRARKLGPLSPHLRRHRQPLNGGDYHRGDCDWFLPAGDGGGGSAVLRLPRPGGDRLPDLGVSRDVGRDQYSAIGQVVGRGTRERFGERLRSVAFPRNAHQTVAKPSVSFAPQLAWEPEGLNHTQPRAQPWEPDLKE